MEKQEEEKLIRKSHCKMKNVDDDVKNQESENILINEKIF